MYVFERPSTTEGKKKLWRLKKTNRHIAFHDSEVFYRSYLEFWSAESLNRDQGSTTKKKKELKMTVVYDISYSFFFEEP